MAITICNLIMEKTEPPEAIEPDGQLGRAFCHFVQESDAIRSRLMGYGGYSNEVFKKILCDYAELLEKTLGVILRFPPGCTLNELRAFVCFCYQDIREVRPVAEVTPLSRARRYLREAVDKIMQEELEEEDLKSFVAGLQNATTALKVLTQVLKVA